MSLMEAPSTVDLILGEAENLRRVGRSLTHCEADAEDLAQETMLRAYRSRARFKPGTSIRAWTTTILRRIFLNDASYRRRRGVRTDTDAGDVLAKLPDRGSPETSQGISSFAVFAEDLDDVVKHAVERVPLLYREAFHRAAIGEMSFKEISAATAVPRGTVMSRVHRARERLRADLVRYPGRPRAQPTPGFHPMA